MSNERGIALPMALMVMVILTALMAAFAVLATSEPQIASNQVASAQARSFAESGLERALWALSVGNNSPAPGGALVLDANYNLPVPVPTPYDGSTFVTVQSGIGGFKVTVSEASPPVSNVKIITAVGFVPNATKPTAIKKITSKVTRIKWINPICGLCAGGENPAGTTTNVQLNGNPTINAQTVANGTAPAGAFCSGVTPASAVGSNGTVNSGGDTSLYAPPGGTQTQNGASFPSTSILTDADTATLKAMAKSTGHYYQGSQSWTSPPPNGLIFVDTVSGNPLTSSSPSSDIPTVDISGNWSAGWSGWLIVAGSLYIHGNVQMSGLIYAQNDVTLHGTGNGAIQGAVISTNRVDTSSTNVDTTDTGNAPISYNCPNVRSGGGQLSQNWFIVPGTYRETSGQ